MARATTFKLTFWRLIFLFLMAAGLYATFVRFTQGLGASTHLSDQFPWGIWISFDVLCGVMLAAGGFTLTAAVHILNIKRLHSIIRPTILTAFLGYILVSAALMFDLGKPYKIWHPLIMRNPHSVMFEVAYCVMLYTTVLALEFSPIVLEHFHLEKPLKVVRAILIPLVITGVILSTLHQSSLGTLYLIVPEKLYPLWYSPLLPVFFFLSAIAVGLAMTIFESSLSSKHFGLQLELPVLQGSTQFFASKTWRIAARSNWRCSPDTRCISSGLRSRFASFFHCCCWCSPKCETAPTDFTLPPCSSFWDSLPIA